VAIPNAIIVVDAVGLIPVDDCSADALQILQLH
jgi:hypothetical protein